MHDPPLFSNTSREKGNQIGRWAINSVDYRNTTGSESSEPHPSPRGLALHSFQAGLLARLHPPPAPSHAKTSHSGILLNSSGLQQRGAAPEYLSRQSPEAPASRFTQIHGSRSRHLKLENYSKRAIPYWQCGYPQLSHSSAFLTLRAILVSRTVKKIRNTK